MTESALLNRTGSSGGHATARVALDADAQADDVVEPLTATISEVTSLTPDILWEIQRLSGSEDDLRGSL